MTTSPEYLSPDPPEGNVKRILEWLALAHGRSGSDDADQLYRQLLLLREAPIPNFQRLKLLDLLYGQAERIASAELPRLHDVSLPISRKLRQRVRVLLDVLETLTQDYFNTLAELFDPEGQGSSRVPHTSLRRAMQTIAWQLRVTNLIAAPSSAGLWQQLHSAFLTARRLGLEDFPGPLGTQSIRQLYIAILLAATAQPASFSPAELEFIDSFTNDCTLPIDLLETPPLDSSGIFWIDLDKDFPAHALIRRIPPSDARVLYFSCETIAEHALKQRAALQRGIPAQALGLPPFADTRAGQSILLRLNQLWGNPAKRRFSRRRQSYRTKLCSGLGNLWHLMKSLRIPTDLSEWMVTNESPDGYSLMHMSGDTQHLRVGDIVALQALGDQAEAKPIWHVCIIRWAVSENPEHIELGLQILAPKAIAVEVTHSYALESSNVAALILPPTPPLRPTQSLVLPAGMLRENTRKIIVVIEADNLEIRQVQATSLNEQTSAIEIFNVVPDD
jgi:cyclic-di-GMP-binding protein